MNNHSTCWKSKLFGLFVVVAALITAAANAQTTNIISLTFAADRSGAMDPSELAGVVAALNWNTISNANGSKSGLIDNAGTTTSAAVTWRANNTWSSGITVTPGNFRLMKSYLDNVPTASTSVIITNIPANYCSNGYDVIVYCDGDNGAEARVGQYTIGTNSIYNQDAPGANFSGTFTQSGGTSDQGTNTPAGNYVRFTGLTNSTFTLVAASGSNTGLASNARAPINGIQIVSLAPAGPVITQNPSDESVCVGQTASFTAAATGATNVQWQVKTNGGSAFTDIVDATNTTLTFTALSSDNGSEFLAVFSNLTGPTTTAPATLTANALPSSPTISFAPQSPCPNSTGNTATGPDGMSGYSWAVVTNAIITSDANSQTVTYTVGDGGTQAVLTLTVTNASGCTAQNTGLATVFALADPTITAAASVIADSTTNTASAPFAPSATYAWSIVNGTISDGANSQTVTFTADSFGQVQLNLSVANSSGCATNSSVTIPIEVVAPTNFAIGDVLTNWITGTANQYVRLYTNTAAKNAGVAVTSWTYTSIDGTNVDNKQPLPVYSGVQAIYSSSNWVYIRSSGMPGSTLGPLLSYPPANMILPTNQHSLFRFPRNATVPTTKTITPGGAIGFMLDGATMFDIRDALVWNGSSEVMNTGTNGYWCRDAYVNEGSGFDPVGGHSSPAGAYHYHADPYALRYRLGDHMTYNAATKTYSEDTNAPTKHSPIIGWVSDGFPVYGPYGYSDAYDSNSGVRRMVSGFVLRDGQNGTANLTLVGRTNIPAWAQRIYGVSLSTGPSVNSSYPLGRYLEDHAYLGDLTNPNTGTNYVKGVDFDLDEYNGRYCVTPEFPNGVYAYFVTIDTNGTPLFPYYIGRAYYGASSGGNVQNLAETVTTNFAGVPNIPVDLLTPSVNGNSVTLTWSATEGGNYRVESSTNLTTWVTNTSIDPAMLTMGSYTGDVSNAPTFFRVALASLASYDSVISTNGGAGGGGGATITMSPNSGTHGQTYTVTATVSASANPPPPPQSGAPIQSFTIGSISVTGASYTYSNGIGTVTGSLTIPGDATTGPQTVTITFSPPPGQQNGPSYTQQNGYTIN